MTIHKNQSIKSYCSEVFRLEKTDFQILGEFAKKGETYRNRIKLAYLSERQIARRINELYKLGFLHLVKLKQYKDSERKNKIFGLSFKGFFTSLAVVEIEKNYVIKKFLKEVDSDIQNNMIEFLKTYILEFLVYHKELGITLEKTKDLATYVREIIYDYSLIEYGQKSKKIFNVINDDIYIIDDINDQIHDLQSSKEKEIFDPEEEGYIPSEANKHEFLINFWPNLLDEIGKGKDFERELMGFSYNDNVFEIKDVKLDIKNENKKKFVTMQNQWSRRKLNFTKPFVFTWSGNNVPSEEELEDSLSKAWDRFERF